MHKQISTAVVAAVLSSATLVPAVAASPGEGAFQMAKECSEYTGQAGSFCTFTSSSIKAIEPGERIVYADAAGAASLDTDVQIVSGPGNAAAGHCTLVFAALPGTCLFLGGTGKFKHFHAVASVSVDASGLWHWEGTYSDRPNE